ncbi:MAG: phosphoadenosine phosphosulfate reductase family protein, partial [Pseudomonadota bacterium]
MPDGIDQGNVTLTAVLNTRYADAPPKELLHDSVRGFFKGRIALVSSFGADSVVLLHMMSEIDRSTPVLLLETGMLFPETLVYQEKLTRTLGL